MVPNRYLSVRRWAGVFHAVGVVVFLLVLLSVLASTPCVRQRSRFVIAVPYAEEQSFGAYLGIGIVAVWSARRYLTQVLRKLLGARSTLDSQDEPISYRTSVVWMVLSVVFLVGFCYKLGMSLWVIATFFGLFFGLATGITRMRAELVHPSTTSIMPVPTG